MHLASILALIGGGAVGVWYGLVDEAKWSFAAGFAAWVVATIATFRGNFNLPEDFRGSPGLSLRNTAYSVATVVLLVLGATGAWVGFVDDIKVGVLAAFVAWGGATFLAFGGRFNYDRSEGMGLLSTPTSATLGFSALIVSGLIVGAAGIWYGLVEDVKIGFAVGMLVWVGTTVATFRGKITPN